MSTTVDEKGRKDCFDEQFMTQVGFAAGLGDWIQALRHGCDPSPRGRANLSSAFVILAVLFFKLIFDSDDPTTRLLG